MTPLLTIITDSFYVELPHNWLAGLLLVVWLGALGWTVWKVNPRNRTWGSSEWGIFILLLIMTPIASLFLGVRLPSGGPLPPPGLPQQPYLPALMVLLAIPLTFAAGILGPAASLALGGISGLFISFWDTHSLFSVVELMFLGLLCGMANWQDYRTRFYRFLRHPIGMALLIGPLYALAYMLDTVINNNGPFVSRLDYTLTHVVVNTIAVWSEFFIAGLLAELFILVIPGYWFKPTALKPSPAESSLQLRFFYGAGSVVAVLLVTLLLGDAVISWNAARGVIRDRLVSISNTASESIPFFLETGQNLIVSIATPDLIANASNPVQLSGFLGNALREVPYFRQLYYFDHDGNPITGYPEADISRLYFSPEEKEGIKLALKGVQVQTYTTAPLPEERTAQITFMTAVSGATGEMQGVLVGRTDLETNPFTQPTIRSLDSLSQMGGSASIIDEFGRVLYNPTRSLVMTDYSGQKFDQPHFYDDTAADGTRSLVYYQPAMGRSWAIIEMVPAREVQQQALNIALPLFMMILLITVLAGLALRFGLQGVTTSLRTLALQSTRISQGQLDHPVAVYGADEVAQLRHAFEQMRISLKNRLEELNRLLLVSQGVASSLEITDSIQPILKAALVEGASSVRIVLAADPSIDIQSESPTHFGIGPSSEVYAPLDEQILTISQRKDEIHLPNVTRGRGLNFDPALPHPGALFAVALRHENRFYGTLWVAYDTPRIFPETQIRFLNTLAGQAALAAANARLYTTAEVGRQRLEAILAATPDPVLVTNHQNRLILSNPAAYQLIGIAGGGLGEEVAGVIHHRDLLGLLTAEANEPASREVAFPDGKVFYATVSRVVSEGQLVGRICVLRDITHFKEVDSLKSDFVATVSHDLRSPLTLMRGYATMMQMVGDLNDQQKAYVRKIITGVENMTRLVNNLLDLGRIEAGVGLKLEMVAVLETAERVISLLQMQAAQKNIKLSLENALSEPLTIQADQALIQQALYNLVENAIKYTPVGGQVRIRMHSRASSLVYEVADTGIGIAPLDQPRLFEKFYRGGQKEAYKQRGSGLGLAIVKSIAERHNGRVWLESQLGKGSVFFFEVPFAQSLTKRVEEGKNMPIDTHPVKPG